MFLGILTMITALCISAVAIYYSVAGLVAIFAAAAVPIMIMGSTLEIAKLVTAVWLHRYWRETSWWLKGYLSTAVVVLMFITSMGIFGFLSSAHIEQTASATEGLAQIERIETELERQEAVILQAQNRIESAKQEQGNRDQDLQNQINIEQDRIDSAYSRIQPAIDEQLEIVESEEDRLQQRIDPLESEIENIDTVLRDLQTAINTGNVERAQGIVGTNTDGDYGPATARAVDEFRSAQIQRRDSLLAQIDTVKSAPRTQSLAARQEISRLRSLAEQQISDSNMLISRLRSQLGQTQTEQVDEIVNQQTNRITQANTVIDELTEQRYALEADYRKLEAEVGPVKYIAEFVYGDAADKDLLEEAVRWVILIIIFVFDPLAVLLLIASQQTFELYRRKSKLQNNDTEEQDNGEFDRVDNVEDNGTEESKDEPVELDTADAGTSDNGGSVLVYSEPEPDPQVIAESFVSKKKI
jgi:peptidoglycan hydrolase-like protein with peptidoglycan-binding domain